MSLEESNSPAEVVQAENDSEDQMQALSKSYNDLLFLQNYSTILSVQKEVQPATPESVNQVTLEMVQSASKTREIEAVTSLDLSNRHLTHFAPHPSLKIESLSSVATLNLSNNALSSLGSIVFLYSIETLDISSNRLSNLIGIDALPFLKNLNVADNMLTSIFHLKNLPKIKSLTISRNKISNVEEFTAELKTLPKLAHLACEKNPIAFDYFYKNELLVGLPKLKTLNGTRVSESDVEVARIFQKHFQASNARNTRKNSNSDSDEEKVDVMAQSDTFGKAAGHANRLRNLANVNRKGRKQNADTNTRMHETTADFRKKKQVEHETVVNTLIDRAPIKTRVLQTNTVTDSTNVSGLQNRLRDLEELLEQRNKEISELRSENVVLKAEAQSYQFLADRNVELSQRLEAQNEQQSSNPGCNSIACKETISALNKRFQECFDELSQLKKDRPQSISDWKLSTIKERQQTPSKTSILELGIEDHPPRQEEPDAEEVDLELEKVLQDSLSKISEAKSMLKSFKRPDASTDVSQNTGNASSISKGVLNLSGENKTSKLELKPIRRTPSLIKQKLAPMRLKDGLIAKQLP